MKACMIASNIVQIAKQVNIRIEERVSASIGFMVGSSSKMLRMGTASLADPAQKEDLQTISMRKYAKHAVQADIRMNLSSLVVSDACLASIPIRTVRSLAKTANLIQ